MELSGTGIHVSLIEPGPIRSKFVEHALEALRSNVDTQRSAHAEVYARRIASMATGGKQTFKLEPEAVLQRLIHAIESPRPKARYFVTVPTYAAALLKRALPTVLLDRFARGQ